MLSCSHTIYSTQNYGGAQTSEVSSPMRCCSFHASNKKGKKWKPLRFLMPLGGSILGPLISPNPRQHYGDGSLSPGVQIPLSPGGSGQRGFKARRLRQLRLKAHKASGLRKGIVSIYYNIKITPHGRAEGEKSTSWIQREMFCSG